jgi:hypothetical protein
MPFGQEPKCGSKIAMFSGRAICIIGSLHIAAMDLIVAHHTKKMGTIVAHNSARREGEPFSSHDEAEIPLQNNVLRLIVGMWLLST